MYHGQSPDTGKGLLCLKENVFKVNTKESYGYIYIVTDLINHRNLHKPFYVGQKKGQFKSNYFGSGKLITYFVKKYGKSRFKVMPIDYGLNKQDLDKLEILWIKKLDCIYPKGYNLANGGDGNTGPHRKDCRCGSCKNLRREPHIVNCKCASCKSKIGVPYIHPKDCQCASCRAKIGTLYSHKAKCLCQACRKMRGEFSARLNHKKNCLCYICRHKRGEPHKIDCGCASCKSKRGETKGKNSGFFGHHHTKIVAEIIRKIRKGKTFEELYGKNKAKKLKLLMKQRKRDKNGRLSKNSCHC